MNDWKSIVVKNDDTIRYAIDALDKSGLRIVLVTDKELRLLGALTDGDVRRAIIAGKDLGSHVDRIMNRAPITADVDTPREELLRIMREKNILSIPLLDNGVLQGLETLSGAMNPVEQTTPVFLMAGGFGTRLRPLTDDCPKPLLKVGDKPILETVINSFIKLGFVDFYISTHYMPEKLRDYFGDGSKWGVGIQYVHEGTPLGTGGALGLLEKETQAQQIILMNGDILTTVDFTKLLKFHNQNNADATMCVREYEYQIPYGVIESEGSRVTSMVEKPVQKFFINAGIYVIGPKVTAQVKQDEYIDMPTLLDSCMSNGQDVLMFPVHEYWLDIGRMDDFHRAQRDIVSLGIG